MEQTEQPAIVIRDARDTDIAEMIDIYYAVESKSRHEPMESWSREEMIEQLTQLHPLRPRAALL